MRSAGSFTCFEPGPWQLSQPTSSRWGVFSRVQKEECVRDHSEPYPPRVQPTVWQRTHSGSSATPFASSVPNATECGVCFHWAWMPGWQSLHAALPTQVAAPGASSQRGKSSRSFSSRTRFQ